MRLTRTIESNCGTHRYPVYFPLGDEVKALVHVKVRTSWNGDGFDDEYLGVDWNGTVVIYGGLIDMQSMYERCGSLAAMETFRSIRERIEADATAYYEDRWHELMLSRL